MRLKSLGVTLLFVISSWIAPPPAQALTVRSIPANWETTYTNAGASARLGASSFTFDESGRDVVATFNVTFISESRQQWPEDAKKAFMRATKI